MSTASLGSTPSVSSVDLHSICQVDDGCMLGKVFLQNLSFRQLSSLSQVSSSLRNAVEKYFSEMVTSYKERPQILPKTQEEAIFDSYLEEAIEEANRFLPATATDIERNKKICRVFFKILGKIYPAQESFSLSVESMLSSLSQIEKKRGDKALIEIMQMVFPADLSPTAAVRTLIENQNFGELFSHLTQGGYEKAIFETARSLLDPIDPQIAINLSAKYPPEVLNDIPAIFLEREDFEAEIGPFLDLIQWVHQVRAVSSILSTPETLPATPENLAKDTIDKAKRLRALLDERLFSSTLGPLLLNAKGISCLPIAFSKLTAGHDYIDLSNNSLTRVPLMSTSIQSLSLAGNPLQEFKNLSHYTAVRGLNLSHTDLTRLPRELLSLPNLANLDLTGNKLISLPRDLACPSVFFNFNPLIYVPPETLERYSCFNLTYFGMPKAEFYAEYLYEPVSSLGKFYKYFVQPEENYKREEIKFLLSLVPEEHRNEIYEWVWIENGKPTADVVTVERVRWGEIHAFEDLALLARAVRRVLASSAFSSFEKATLLFRSLGYHNGYVYNDRERFKLPYAAYADILSITEGSPQPFLFPMQQLAFVKECWALHHQIRSYLKDQETETASRTELMKTKCRLRSKWEKLLETHRQIGESLPESTLMPSFIAETVRCLETVLPHSQTIAEIVTERHAIIPPGLHRDNYEGDFDLEVSYRPQSQLGDQIHSLLDLNLEPYRPKNFLEPDQFCSLAYDVLGQLTGAELFYLTDIHNYAINNPSQYAQALKTVVRNVFDGLPLVEKNKVYEKIYHLAGNPATDDLQWGEHHAFDCWSRLADAITFVKDPTSEPSLSIRED